MDTTNRHHRPGGHAVVLGGSIAGLLAARVLADVYDEITLIERDPIAEWGVRHRKGVPQSHHIHALQPRGLEVLEALLPGLTLDLRREGAVPAEPGVGQRFALNGHLLARVSTGLPGIQATREVLEACIRRSVLQRPEITVRDETDVAGLTHRGDTVTGVRVLSRSPGAAAEVRSCDLVVDALGRGSRTPDWLADVGFPPVPVEGHRVDLTYVSMLVRLPRLLAEEARALIIGSEPGRPTGMGLMAVQGGRFILTAAGIAGHRPPREPDQVLDFAADLLPAGFASALDGARPDGRVHSFTCPQVERRRFDHLPMRPQRLVAVGDALCTFNPLYGQGLTVAALEAQKLAEAALRGPHRLVSRYDKATRPVVDAAWEMAKAADLAIPEIPGKRPLSIRVMNRYVARVQAAAASDPALAGRFLRVAGLTDGPQALMSPTAVARTFLARPRGRPHADTAATTSP
jgi:2-polyprenyl-6-methoxyphenol hydroxylase-like FAD-dependent oxidoreductase